MPRVAGTVGSPRVRRTSTAARRAAGGTACGGGGSGTRGPRTVRRPLGVAPAVLALVGDIVKGSLAVTAARSIGTGAWAAAAGLPPLGAAPAPAQARADLSAWRPAAVLAVTSPGSALGRYLVQLLGRPALRSGSVLAWRLRPARAATGQG